MKRMQFGRRGPAGPNERKRPGKIKRAFHKIAGTLLLSAGLALAGPSITTGPDGPKIGFSVKEAKAATPVRIKGVKVYKMTLTDTLSNLDRKSKPYRKGATILKVPANGLVTTVGLTGRSKTITLSFPKSATDSTVVNTGFKLDGLISLVRKVSGKTPTKAKLIVEFGKVGSQRTINVFVIPLDNGGNIIGKLPNNGGQLAMGVSYYPQKGKAYGAKVLLSEPRKPAVGAVASSED